MKYFTRMKKTYLILIVYFLLCTSTLAFEKIKLSTIEYPPISQSTFLSDLGYGIAGDLTAAAFKAVDMDVEFDFIPMVRCVESVIKKKHPATLGSINWFAINKKENLVETIDLLKIHFLLFYKKKKFPEGISYEKLSEFKQYSIGNVRGSATTPVVEKAGLNIEWVRNLELNYRKLYAERIDFVIGAGISGSTLIRKMYPDCMNIFSTVKKPVLSIPISLIFHEDQRNLLKEFKAGLNVILENGIYYGIMEKYYGKDWIWDDVLPKQIKNRIKKII